MSDIRILARSGTLPHYVGLHLSGCLHGPHNTVADPGGGGGSSGFTPPPPSEGFFVFACQYMKIPADLDPNPPPLVFRPRTSPRRIPRSAPVIYTHAHTPHTYIRPVARGGGGLEGPKTPPPGQRLHRV